jgi:hypothetical protein
MKKLNNSKKALTRSEMRSVTGGYLPCGFANNVCPDFPMCNEDTNTEGYELQCIHHNCIVVYCNIS